MTRVFESIYGRWLGDRLGVCECMMTEKDSLPATAHVKNFRKGV